MANTREILGDQETVERLISDTLETFEEDGIASFANGGQSFQSRKALMEVIMPNLINTGQGIFADCTALEEIDMPNIRTLGATTFSGCHSLTDLDLDNTQLINAYAFERSGIGRLILPECTTVYNEICRASRIGTIDFYKKINIMFTTFARAPYLTSLIFRNENMSELSVPSTTAFGGSPIANGMGWIYVPSELVNDYKTAPNWSELADQIVSLDEYPKAMPDETITDSWEEILDSIDNDSYLFKYGIGDVKYLNVGGTWIAMEIIAFDKDMLPGGGVAPITWLSRDVLQYAIFDKDSSLAHSWNESGLRTFLREKILDEIDPTVSARIQAVTKTYTVNGVTGETHSIEDTIWIPSYRELIGDTSRPYCETSGIDYSFPFTDSLRRIKRYGINGETMTYWLRTRYSPTSIAAVSTNGNGTSSGCENSNGIVFGFCT